jgi:hypothetical protein
VPVILPLNSQGSRTVRVPLSQSTVVQLRTKYMPKANQWVLDILNEDETPILLGIVLYPGLHNLLKGQGQIFKGYKLVVVAMSGTNSAPDSLGNSAFALWYGRGEESPFKPGDPLSPEHTGVWFRRGI